MLHSNLTFVNFEVVLMNFTIVRLWKLDTQKEWKKHVLTFLRWKDWERFYVGFVDSKYNKRVGSWQSWKKGTVRHSKSKELAYCGHTMRKQWCRLENDTMQGTLPGASSWDRTRMDTYGQHYDVERTSRGRVNRATNTGVFRCVKCRGPGRQLYQKVWPRSLAATTWRVTLAGRSWPSRVQGDRHCPSVSERPCTELFVEPCRLSQRYCVTAASPVCSTEHTCGPTLQTDHIRPSSIFSCGSHCVEQSSCRIRRPDSQRSLLPTAFKDSSVRTTASAP